MELLRRGIVVAALLLLAVGPAARAEDSKHAGLVTGTGEGVDQNAAKAAARRNAIEQVVGVMVKASGKTVDSASVVDKILTVSQGVAILKNEINKGKEGDVFKFTGEYLVSVVPAAQVLKDTGLIREWRVMVFIPEVHIQRPVPDPAAETEFVNQFVKAGFKVIDKDRYKDLRQQEAERLATDPKINPKVALEIARKMGADIVITGEAFSERMADAALPEEMRKEGFISCRARVEIKAYLADTAEILSSDALAGGGTDLVESVAAKSALQRTAKKLAPQFVNDLMLLPAANTRKVQLEVRVFDSFGDADDFEEALGNVEGVNKVHRDSYDEGVLVLDVDIDVESASALAKAMEKSKALKPFGIKVNAVSNARIRATVKKKD